MVTTAESSTTRDAEIIAGSAGVGAVIGAIAGGKKGAGIGAISGGGAGTGVVLATKGKDVRYAAESRLSSSVITFTFAPALMTPNRSGFYSTPAPPLHTSMCNGQRL